MTVFDLERCGDHLVCPGDFRDEHHYCTREPGHVGKHGDSSLSWANPPAPNRTG